MVKNIQLILLRHLTSVESGSVEINQSENELTLLDNGVNKYQDINLNQQSLIDASGEKVGTIAVIGKNINLSNGSFILAQNRGNFSDGLINIKASESITLSSNSSDGNIDSVIRTEALNSAEGAELNILANRLVIKDFGSIQTATFSEANSGDLNIKVSESIDLSQAAISSVTFGKGNAGDINLLNSRLRLTDISIISSSSFGKGNAGTVLIDSDSIEIIGTLSESGDITNISSSSFSTGNAGNIIIETERLHLTNGALVSSSSFSTGNSGSLTIKTSEILEVSGTNEKDSSRQSTIRTAVRTVPPAIQRRFNLPAVPNGNSGSLTINTPSLKISQEGIVSVENQGTGRAGTLIINADNLNLDESGSITAAAESGLGGNIQLNTQNLNITNDSQITASAGGNENGGNITINTTNLTAKKKNQITASAFEGDGGNININAADSVSLNERDSISATSQAGLGGNITLNTEQLQIKNNSLISTSAGGDGNGGNIEITAGTILAINDSDITATAVRGNGGNITITADGILGIEERKAEPGNGTSDIDASSELGEDGTVKISDPQVLIQDPIVAMKEPKFDNIEPKFTGDCVGGKELLTDSRHDNVPARPDELLGGNQYIPDADFVPPPAQPKPEPNSIEDLIWKQGAPIASGNMIVATPDGKVLLVVKSQFESLRKRGCLPANIKILEDSTAPTTFPQSN